MMFQRAGIRRQDEFSAAEHQYPRALREFTVVTDHAADLDRPLRRVERADGEAVAGCERAFHVELAGVYLRVSQHDLAVPINQ